MKIERDESDTNDSNIVESSTSNSSNLHSSAFAEVQTKANALKTFVCSECPQSFTKTSTLMRHAKVHQKGREYTCGMCEKWFSCKSSLDRHKRIHTGEKPFTCEECGKSFVQKEILKRHQITHTGRRPYQCPHCPKSFVQKLVMTHHINAMHLKVPKIFMHDCQLCPKVNPMFYKIDT